MFQMFMYMHSKPFFFKLTTCDIKQLQIYIKYSFKFVILLHVLILKAK